MALVGSLVSVPLLRSELLYQAEKTPLSQLVAPTRYQRHFFLWKARLTLLRMAEIAVLRASVLQAVTEVGQAEAVCGLGQADQIGPLPAAS